MSPEESAAVAILWAKEGGVGDVPESEVPRLLALVRERSARIEADVVQMAVSRIREGRRTPRRHQLMAFAILAIGAALVFLVLLMSDRLF